MLTFETPHEIHQLGMCIAGLGCLPLLCVDQSKFRTEAHFVRAHCFQNWNSQFATA